MSTEPGPPPASGPSKEKDDFPEFGDPSTLGPNGKPLGWYRWAAWFASKCWSSQLLPEQVKTGAMAFTILCKGDELGLPPFAAWTWIYVTKQRRLAIMSKGALAVVQSKPAFAGYREWVEGDGTPEMKAVASAQRKGFPETIKDFSLKEAEHAGLLRKRKNRDGDEYDSTWQSYEKDMLLSRARGRALDIAFAAELGGIAVEGVAEDIDMMAERESPRGRAHVDRQPFTMLPAAEQRALSSGKAQDPLALALSRVVTDGKVERGTILLKQPDGSEAGRIVNVAEPIPLLDPALVQVVVGSAVAPEMDDRSPELKARIAADADYIFGGAAGAPTPGGTPAGKRPPEPEDTPGGADRRHARVGVCPRCGYKLNPLEGCDACGWPGSQDLR